MQAELVELLCQYVHIFEPTRNAYGDITNLSGATDENKYRARVQYAQKPIFDREGMEVISTAQVFLDSNVTITPISVIVLPDNSAPKIKSVKPYFDNKGLFSYLVVYV